MHPKHLILFFALSFLACQSAHGNRSHRPDPSSSQATSSYSIKLVDDHGSALNSYFHKGRHYVLGSKSTRYTIRVYNLTPGRVEAVASVDGLDVIDGQPATTDKRGYIIDGYGYVDIDGFRTSEYDVAAFRFSSVRDSYAGRLGKARHVGVIGVAIFTEKERPALAKKRLYHYEEDRLGRAEKAKGGAAMDDLEAGFYGAEEAAQPAQAERRAPSKSKRTRSQRGRDRAGLGTEFGERRTSQVTHTQFVRAHETRPALVHEIRYNNARGLRALGIRIPRPYNEVKTRERANPFPADRRRYSEAPPRR